MLLLDSFTYINNFSLAGVYCPRVNTSRVAVGDEDVDAEDVTNCEPFGQQAKHFVELRLLNREVDIVIQKIEKGRVFGTVVHPKGDIAHEILRNGLGRVADAHLDFLPKAAVYALRVAEKAAKDARRFLWATPRVPAAPLRTFWAQVVEVISGDNLLVNVESEGSAGSAEVKIFLSSIRAPRLLPIGGGRSPRESRDKDKDKPPATSEDYGLESREYLRHRIIGRRVQVTVDYEKAVGASPRSSAAASGAVEEEPGSPSAAAAGRRLHCTVRCQAVGSKSVVNPALGLVAEGLARCVRHREGEPRSGDLDSLLIAEAEAAVKAKGVHGATAARATARIVDLTDGKRTAALLADSLNTPLRAVVEYVYSGSRVKALLLHGNYLVQLSLAQVRCPLTSRPAGGGGGKLAARQAEPFAEEAKRHTRLHLLQRLVEVYIDSIDKNGIALGRIYFEGGLKNQSFALTLVRAGLAKMDSYKPYKRDVPKESKDAREKELREKETKELLALEEEAQEAQLGLWSVPQEDVDVSPVPDDAADDAEEEDAEVPKAGVEGEVGSPKSPAAASAPGSWKAGSTLNVTVSEIVDGVTFFLQREAGAETLAALTSSMEALGAARDLNPATAVAAAADAQAPAATTASAEVAVEDSPFRKGKLVAAFFDEGVGLPPTTPPAPAYWCRARIEELVSLAGGGPKTAARISYIDYGHSDVMALANLIPINASHGALLSTPPLAQECKLALLKPPPVAMDVGDGCSVAVRAGFELRELAWGHPMVATVLAMEMQAGAERGGRDRDKRSSGAGQGHGARAIVQLHRADEVDGESVNELMVSAGLARVSRRGVRDASDKVKTDKVKTDKVKPDKKSDKTNDKLAELAQRLTDALAEAKAQRLNMFRYGEPDDSEDENRERSPREVGGRGGGRGGAAKSGGRGAGAAGAADKKGAAPAPPAAPAKAAPAKKK